MEVLDCGAPTWLQSHALPLCLAQRCQWIFRSAIRHPKWNKGDTLRKLSWRFSGLVLWGCICLTHVLIRHLDLLSTYMYIFSCINSSYSCISIPPPKPSTLRKAHPGICWSRFFWAKTWAKTQRGKWMTWQQMWQSFLGIKDLKDGS